MKIIVIDDDKLVCASLKVILQSDPDIEVAAVGHNGRDAISLYEEHQPDVLLMDIRMEAMNGLEAGKAILAAHPQAHILYLTTFLDDEYIIQALNIGSKGYLLKQDFESIVPALRAVHSGQSVFGGDIISKIPELLNQQKAFDYSCHGITEKETEIIRLVADGLSNKEISDILFLSEGTIRNYLSIILDKLNLRDRTQLAIFYHKNK